MSCALAFVLGFIIAVALYETALYLQAPRPGDHR
jgi:hypothetical protein